MINSNNNPYSLPSQYIIENDDILNIDFYGNKNKVGVTTKKYEELSNICDKYYNKLVELGAITPPKTQEQIIQEQTQDMTNAGLAVIGNKIDFYEYQNLRDQLAEAKNKNLALENRIYSDNKFNAIERQNEGMYTSLKQEIASLGCELPKRPAYYAQGYLNCGYPIPPASAYTTSTSCGC